MKTKLKSKSIFVVFAAIFLSLQANSTLASNDSFATTAAQKTYIYALEDGEGTPEKSSIKKYDNDGNLINTWALSFSARNLATSNDGTIYVTGEKQVHLFTSEGQACGIWDIGGAPWQIATDSKGYVYIVDNYRNFNKYDHSGRRVATWPWVADKFYSIRAIAIDSADRVYINDPYKVCQYDSNGYFLSEIGSQKIFGVAVKIAFDTAGNSYIFDHQGRYPNYGNYIYKFDSSGIFQNTIHLDDERRVPPFTNDIFAIDTNNNAFLLEPGIEKSSISKLNLDGSVIKSWDVDSRVVSIALGTK